MVKIKWEDKYGMCNASYNMTNEEASKLWEETHTNVKNYFIEKMQYINSKYKEEKDGQK